MTTSMPFSQDFFALSGALGAIIMFVADLVLYLPLGDDANSRRQRTAASYFATIDPGGDNLANSSMKDISVDRVMCGGAMGPVSAVFYNIGFLGLVFGFEGGWFLPGIAAVCLSLMMTIAAVYHALFAYTCFLSMEIAKNPDSHQALLHLLQRHQTYLRYIYKWAAVPGMIGSLAYICCCLTRATEYPRYSMFFVPVVSGPIKKLLKERSFGGIVLCGGLTNLWNLCFFAILHCHAA